MSDYKLFSKAAIDVVRKDPKGYEAYARRGGTLPMENSGGAADVFDAKVKRAIQLARDQHARDQHEEPTGFKSTKDQLPGQGEQKDPDEQDRGQDPHKQHMEDLSQGEHESDDQPGAGEPTEDPPEQQQTGLRKFLEAQGLNPEAVDEACKRALGDQMEGDESGPPLQDFF